jgi:hypothetical protein
MIAQTLLPTPKAGRAEFNGTTLYFTPKSQRAAIDLTRSVLITPVTVANTTTPTTVYSTIIEAGFLTIGKVIKLEISGYYSNNTALNVATIAIKIGGTTVMTFTTPLIAITNKPLHIDFTATIKTIGNSGTFAAHGMAVLNNEVRTNAPTNTISIDTTVDNDIEVVLTWDEEHANNTATINQGFLTLKN